MKNSLIIVVHNGSKIYHNESQIFNKAGKKEQGEVTSCLYPLWYLLSLCNLLPYFFISKFVKMHNDKNKYSQLSQIMSNAWYYFRKGIFITFSECLKAAWKAYKVTKQLRKGKLSFSFRKATGEIRNAIGTLNDALYEFTAKGVRQEPKPDAIKYYDLEKDAWRMFRIERLLTINTAA